MTIPTSREKAEAIWDVYKGISGHCYPDATDPNRINAIDRNKGDLIEQTAAIIGDDWISVEDRLPEEDEEYYDVTRHPKYESKDVALAMFYQGSWWWPVAFSEGGNTLMEDVTHWCERPEPAR